MWDYSEKVKEHFFNPRNAGRLAGANGTGEVGSIACGDALRLTLKVDPETEVILDAGFETFGCGSAIASSSALTELAKGKTLDEALAITNQDIATYLDGLPPEKMHCSVMGREALHAAIANYRGETLEDEHEEGALLCRCFAVDAKLVERTAMENDLQTVQDVMNFTKAGGACACCHEGIERVLNEVKARRSEAKAPASSPRQLPVTTPAAAEARTAGSSAKPLTNLERVRRVEAAIASVRPVLVADGGDVELLEFDGDSVYVRMTGACAGCMASTATIGLIQQRIMERLGEFVPVVPVQSGRLAVGG